MSKQNKNDVYIILLITCALLFLYCIKFQFINDTVTSNDDYFKVNLEGKLMFIQNFQVKYLSEGARVSYIELW